MTPTGTSMEMRTGWGIKLRGGGEPCIWSVSDPVIQYVLRLQLYIRTSSFPFPSSACWFSPAAFQDCPIPFDFSSFVMSAIAARFQAPSTHSTGI